MIVIVQFAWHEVPNGQAPTSQYYSPLLSPQMIDRVRFSFVVDISPLPDLASVSDEGAMTLQK